MKNPVHVADFSIRVQPPDFQVPEVTYPISFGWLINFRLVTEFANYSREFIKVSLGAAEIRDLTLQIEEGGSYNANAAGQCLVPERRYYIGWPGGATGCQK